MNNKTVWFTIGGSHRQYAKDNAKIKAAGIAARWVGPISLGSKRHQVSVSEADAEKMVSLGFSRSRQQPNY